jgi:hypothetical protein
VLKHRVPELDRGPTPIAPFRIVRHLVANVQHRGTAEFANAVAAQAKRQW